MAQGVHAALLVIYHDAAGAALHDHLQLPADDGPVYGIYRFQPFQR